ncbi:two-component system response regulator [Spirochaetia bacterium]|nr:two-component system response regulator [Spirochaetia bacterium]
MGDILKGIIMKKKVLVIDESPLVREYLKTKLLENKGEVEADTAGNSLEAAGKMRIGSPDLILLDYPLGETCIQVLQEKRLNPNTAKVPVILMAQKIDQEKIIELLPFGVKKVFTKPFRVDALFKTVSELLGVRFTIDTSPGIIDVHVNSDILFIELARGLNHDKLDMLYYRVTELLTLYEMSIPRIIIMLSDLNLNLKGGAAGNADFGKLEKLLHLLLKASKAKRRILHILTKDENIRRFVTERREYAEYRLVSTLQEAMNLLYADEKPAPEAKADAPAEEGEASPEIEDADADAEVLEDIADLVESKGTILNADDPKTEEAMLLRFDRDYHKHLTTEALREVIRNLRIGAVDDDGIILEMIRNIFETAGASVKTYLSGAEFLKEPEMALFDLVFMDLVMPEPDGFMVLEQLQAINYQTPVIVLSSMTKQEMVIKAFQMGVKSYLYKPLNPEDVFKKTLEILKPNF